jgi:ABC-2 type transport system permease protein
MKAPFLLKKLLRINPIIVKEIRSRMRGPRVFITLTLMLLTMGGLMYAALQIILANSRFSSILSPQVGQVLFASLAFMELFMICAITPAVTAGAISSEKEKQTYEMLMSTPLSPTSVLLGKLISALSYVLLLLFAGIPLASVVFIFGGVDLREMLKGLLVLLMFAISFGILGIFFSALFGRTGRSTVASFITVVLLMIGPLFLAAIVGVLRNGEPPRWLLAPSPISALSAAIAPSLGSDSGGNVFYFLSGIFNLGVAPISQTSIPRPLYHYTLPFYLLLSLLLYMLATRLVQPTRRWRIGRRELFTGLSVLFLLLALIVGGFFLTAPHYEWATNPQATAGQGALGAAVQAMPAPLMGPGVAKEVMIQPVATIAPMVATATPVPGPTQTPPPTSTAVGSLENLPTAVPQDEATQAEIYAAVARQMLGVDNTFGGHNPGWKTVYLVSTTNDAVGDPNLAQARPVELSSSVMADVSKRLSNLPVKIVWVQSRESVPTDPKTSEVIVPDAGSDAKGVIFTFGNIHPQKDGSVQVSGSLYFANLGAGGKTYLLQKVDGVWKITGTTGVEWIS